MAACLEKKKAGPKTGEDESDSGLPGAMAACLEKMKAGPKPGDAVDTTVLSQVKSLCWLLDQKPFCNQR